MKNIVIGTLMLIAFLFRCNNQSPKASILTTVAVNLAEISITDDASALSAGGNDTLFKLTLVKRSSNINPADLQIIATAPGKIGQSFVNPAIQGDNGNNLLDVGETLLISEGGANRFDTSHVNKSISVQFLSKRSDGSFLQEATSTWQPTN